MATRLVICGQLLAIACTSGDGGLSAELQAGHRRVGQGSDISVWLTDESASVRSLASVRCDALGCAVEVELRGVYRDYSASPVEGRCCDSRLDQRTWDATVLGTVTRLTDPERFQIELTDTDEFEISVLNKSTRETGEVFSDTQIKGFDAYPGLIGRGGSSTLVREGCGETERICWTVYDWLDADGEALSGWAEGRAGGVWRAGW